MPGGKLGLFLSIILTFSLLARCVYSGIPHEEFEDNEFAEFETEDFGVEEETAPETQKTEEVPDNPKATDDSADSANTELDNDDDEATVETEDSEFEHVDDEEFEGFDTERPKSDQKPGDGPKITFAKLPAHLRSNWESYMMELLILAGLLVYFLNFFIGRAKNQKIAEIWFNTFKPLLQENFSLVGDDGKLENSQPGLIKESENVYLLWCSGRTCCEGMLIELRLAKRQDLVSVLAGILKPHPDQIHVKVFMNDDMDPYVMCLAVKKSATRLAKEMADISVYCPERKSTEKYNLPPNFVLMSEIGEAASSLLDVRVCSIINKIPEVIDSIHISDQYSGAKQPEDSTPSKMPETRKMLLFSFNLALRNGKTIAEAVEHMRPSFSLVFYLLERAKRLRLSKEAKAKAEKNRSKVEEAFLKSTHAARAEAAAARREEKRRLEKEKIMQEDDPEKQRKWEEKEAKRLAKKRMPKMKAIKV